MTKMNSQLRRIDVLGRLGTSFIDIQFLLADLALPEVTQR